MSAAPPQTRPATAVRSAPGAAVRRRAAAVPKPLALLLVVVALFTGAWAIVVPAWQAPDEVTHFAYAQTIAEQGRLPGGARPEVSSEQLASIRRTNRRPGDLLDVSAPRVELRQGAGVGARDALAAARRRRRRQPRGELSAALLPLWRRCPTGRRRRARSARAWA